MPELEFDLDIFDKTEKEPYQLSPHFHKKEFNQPQAPLKLETFEVNPILTEKLEELRTKIGDKPIKITSGYRSPEYNKRVGGVSKSQHLTGSAADITVKGITSKELQKAAQEVGFSFTQTYQNKPHLHVDVRGLAPDALTEEEAELPELRAAPPAEVTPYRPPMTPRERGEAWQKLVGIEPTPIEKIAKFAEETKPITETLLLPLWKLLEAERGVVGAVEPKTTIWNTLISSAYKGIAEPEKVAISGEAAAKAYPNAPWWITGALGAGLEVLTIFGLGHLGKKQVERTVAKAEQMAPEVNAGLIREGFTVEEANAITSKGGLSAYFKKYGAMATKQLKAKHAILLGEVGPTAQFYAGLPVPKSVIQKFNLTPTQVSNIKKGILTGIPVGALKELKITPPVKPEVAKPPVPEEVAKIPPEAPPVIEPGIPMATDPQKAQAHIIAKGKMLVTPEGKTKPQYRKLAENMTGKKSMKDMTQDEAGIFIDALEGLPEPTYKAGKLVPPTIPRTTAVVTEDYFERTFKKPTPVKLLTSQARYAELLGVKELAEPFEIGKQQLDIEYGQAAKQIDTTRKKLKEPEKMAQLLNIYEEAPPELMGKERDAFDYFRDLTRDVRDRENSVRMSLGLEPIKYRKAYFRHIADKMSREVIEGKYPLPEGIKFWSEQVVGKKVYNPMEMQRRLRDDLLEHFSKDLSYVMKSMAWTGLKEIYLAQPKYFFNRVLGALSKDKAVYKNLTPQEQAHYDAQMTMPATTKKWLIDYVNIVLSSRQTALDQSVNLWVTDTPIKTVVNSILRPFGKHIGQKPITNMITNFSKLPIYGVMGGIRPRQLLRNKFQTIQNMALYGAKNTLRGYLPTSSYPTLERLKTDSLFRKSYSGFEDMPVELRGKIEKAFLAPYQWSAVSNVSQAMNCAYHWTADNIQNPKKKHLEWADPKRTYTEDRDFFYPSEIRKLLKEMEYGAHTTQFQYIGMGMPEIFRYKALAPLTRLQSWWMNHWFIFHREAATRAFTGRVGYDPNLKVTLGDRINYLKYLVIGGLILNTLGYERSYLFGTAPTSLPPPAQLMLGLYTYFTHTGDTDWEKRKRAEASYQIREASKTFIPGYLAVKDIAALLSGEKDWTEYLWYKKSLPREGEELELDFDLDMDLEFEFEEIEI